MEGTTMTTTLASLGIDPTSHSFISSDLLLAGKLTALYQYAKGLEEMVKELEEFMALEHPSHLNLSQQNIP